MSSSKPHGTSDNTTLTSSLVEQDVHSMDALIRPFSSLSDLLSSPSVLSSETSLLTSELTSLCHASHSTFLLLHDTSTALRTSFDTLTSSLDSLLSTIPSLHKSSEEFARSTKPILEERRRAGLILEQQEKLADLLEIPILIDTCARNEMYQDAMDLWIHASTLIQQLRTSETENVELGIVKSLEKEIEGSIRLMIGGLVEQLKGPAKLLVLHRVVGFLRQISGWREDELATLFLCCRGAFIDSMHSINEVAHAGTGSVKDGSREDVTKYLRGYLEVFREGVKDAITAYTTIFIDHHDSITSSSEQPQLRFILSTFTDLHVSALLSTLFNRLPSIQDFTSLSSLLNPVTFCGNAFANIGLDFRPLLSGPFERAVLSNIKTAFEDATNAFTTAIRESESVNLKPSSWLVAVSTSGSHDGRITLPQIPDTLDSSQSSVSQFTPPQILTFSPLLATYLNAQLNTFNALRSLAILSLLPEIYSLLCVSLTATMAASLDYARIIASPTSPTMRMSFERSRTSVSLERKNSESKSSSTRSRVDSTGRPMSPSIRPSTPTSGRPYSPTPRQVFTGDTVVARQEQEVAIVIAVGKAQTRILTPFLKKGLVEGVYAAESRGLLDRNEALDAIVNEWESWIKERTPKATNGADADGVS